jgi:hypothetical protein
MIVAATEAISAVNVSTTGAGAVNDDAIEPTPDKVKVTVSAFALVMFTQA